MAVFICLALGTLVTIALVVLAKLRYYEACGILVLVVILLISFFVGGISGAKLRRRLAPYFFYDTQKVRSEHIKVVDYVKDEHTGEGMYLFSNGERIDSDESSTLNLIMGVSYTVVGGAVMLLGYALFLRLIKRFFPNFHAEITTHLFTRKRPLD